MDVREFKFFVCKFEFIFDGNMDMDRFVNNKVHVKAMF